MSYEMLYYCNHAQKISNLDTCKCNYDLIYLDIVFTISFNERSDHYMDVYYLM